MSRFQMPTEPRNGLDLLRWIIFEPVLLQRFEKTLSKKDIPRWLLKVYLYIIVISAALYLLSLSVTVTFDLPVRFPQIYEPEFITEWPEYNSNLSQFEWLFLQTINPFVGMLVVVLVFMFFINLFNKPSDGLTFETVSGIAIGTVGGIAIGLGRLIDVGESVGDFLFFGGGVWLGLVFCVGREHEFGLIVGPLYMLMFKLFFWLGNRIRPEYVLDDDMLGVFLLAFYLMYFRLPFYLFHLAYSMFADNFQRNSYLKDGMIWLPLFPLDKKLVRQAYETPTIAAEFAEFLFEFRPFQEKLAVKIRHAANAGHWAQYAVELDADVFQALSFPEKQKKFHPSETWNASLEHLRTQLISSQTQTKITLRKEAFEQFFDMLKAFRSQTLLESRKWNHFYLDAIDTWLKVSAEHLETLKQQAELKEPITSNIYKANDALHRELDQTIFVGRDDLKDALSFEILTAKQMPLFLIQGQRRVGKTSLLNFLPLLLGPRFKIVPIDLQGLENQTVNGFLFALRNTINKTLSIQEENAWNPPEDWLRAWGEFREYVEQLTNGKDFKLVLAFDEYETLHDSIFQRDPQQAARLLGAMRSFSQSQNQVVFLFVGARFFSELQQPNWNEYFVQVKHLRVDYLKRPDVLHLIQHPTPDFGLVYADDLANRIFDLTQGHPALVQQICSEMVTLANTTNHRQMTHDDLDFVLYKNVDGKLPILSRETLAINIFWTQFCAAPAERATVKQILAGETPTDPVSRYRLELHGYIVKDGDNWTMRVPLFEQWLRKYIETFPI